MKELTIRTNSFSFENPELNARCNAIAMLHMEQADNLKRIAIEAYRIDKEKLIPNEYKNTAEFLMDTFGYGKSFAYDIIAVGRRIDEVEMQSVLTEFSLSQLKEMNSLSNEQITEAVENGEISADMSAKAIREAAKEIKGGKARAKSEPKKYWFIPMDGIALESMDHVQRKCVCATEDDFYNAVTVKGTFTCDGEKYFVTEFVGGLWLTYHRSKNVPAIATVEDAE